MVSFFNAHPTEAIKVIVVLLLFAFGLIVWFSDVSVRVYEAKWSVKRLTDEQYDDFKRRMEAIGFRIRHKHQQQRRGSDPTALRIEHRKTS